MLERIGNCRIVEEVASGGMAVVYRAIQDTLDRTVAIKALKTSAACPSGFTLSNTFRILPPSMMTVVRKIPNVPGFRSRWLYLPERVFTATGPSRRR